MKVFILFLFVVTLSFAKTIVFNDDFQSKSTINEQIVVEDSNSQLSAQNIYEGNYTSVYHTYFTKYTNASYWTKVSFKNNSKSTKTFVFRNPRAGIDKIDVSIYKEGLLEKTYALGDMREQSLHPMRSIKSVFSIDLHTGEEVSIVTRFESLGAMYLGWEIVTLEHFTYTSSLELIFYAGFGGIMLALIIYNIIMYISLREIAFLLYSLHGLCALWFEFAYTGMFYFLNLGINLTFLTLSTWFMPVLMVVFLVLFTMSFFDMQKRNKNYFKIFTFFVLIDFLIFLLFVYQLFDSSFIIFTPYFLFFIFATLVLVFSFNLYAVYKNYIGARYFFIGEGTYLGALVYISIVIGGKIDLTNTWQYMLIPFGILVDMIFLSMALSRRIADIKDDNDFKNNLLQEEEKFVSVGKKIGYVTHQWKEPISQLSSQLMYLESLYALDKKELLVSEFATNIAQMNKVLEYMKETVNELYNFYSHSDEKGHFNLNKQIAMASKLQHDNLLLNHIELEIDCDNEIFVMGAKHAFSNVLMILFENSIYEFTRQSIQTPKISIKVKSSENFVELFFSDNGGGFNPKDLAKLFVTNYTTKGEDGCGFGLPLTKMLLEERLYGTISLQNSAIGAVFIIKLQRIKLENRD